MGLGGTPPGICHPERVIKLLYLIVFIADNLAFFDCVGTVQVNCANFSRCSKSLGHEGTSSANLRVRPRRWAFLASNLGTKMGRHPWVSANINSTSSSFACSGVAG